MTNTIAFNTGRTYTESGQRIAARQLESGHIVMLDIDRGIDYMFPARVDLTQRAVMRAYDCNVIVFPSDVGLDYSDYYAVLADLRAVANDVLCV
jgi:hypothetical protein